MSTAFVKRLTIDRSNEKEKKRDGNRTSYLTRFRFNGRIERNKTIYTVQTSYVEYNNYYIENYQFAIDMWPFFELLMISTHAHRITTKSCTASDISYRSRSICYYILAAASVRVRHYVTSLIRDEGNVRSLLLRIRFIDSSSSSSSSM